MEFKTRVFWLKLVGFIFFFLIYIVYVAFCAAQDSKEHSLIAELKNENNVFKKAISGIIFISQENSSKINACMHEYLSDGKINTKIWSYKKACYNLCATIYEFIIKLTGNEKVEVSYVKLNENIPGEIQLYAYKNQSDQIPNLLNKTRNYKPNVFTSGEKIRSNYAMHLMASITMPAIDKFITINGIHNGYMMVIKDYKEVHIKKGDLTYNLIFTNKTEEEVLSLLNTLVIEKKSLL